MFKVGDLIKSNKLCNEEDIMYGLLKGEVIAIIGEESTMLVQIIEHLCDNKNDMVFETYNSNEYLELLKRKKEKLKFENVKCLINGFNEDIIAQRELCLRNILRDKDISRNEFTTLIKKEDETKNEINAKYNGIKGNISKKIYDELVLIQNDKKCEKLEIDGTKLIIYTPRIYIEDKKYTQGNFKMNKYKIIVNFMYSAIDVEGVEQAYYRKSCWEGKSPHPHISHRGRPCWGNTESMLKDTMENQELYAMFMLVINFLETFNLSDAAGKKIKNWDYVSKEDDSVILENPYRRVIRLDCGCAVNNYDEEHRVYNCSICDSTICYDCFYTCERCGSIICSTHKTNDEYDVICVNCETKK